MIQGDFKGLYSYYDATYNKNPGLFVQADAAHCDATNDNKVHLINGRDLKKCLNNANKSLVYIWSPKCSSRVCIPLETVQQYAITHNLELFIAAEYYDIEMMNKIYKTKKPLYGIDTEYYQSNVTKKYLSRFLTDLSVPDTITDRYLFFEGKNYSHSQSELDLRSL